MNNDFEELCESYKQLDKNIKKIELVNKLKELQSSFKSLLSETDGDDTLLFDQKIDIYSDDFIDSIYMTVLSLENVAGRAISSALDNEK